MAPSLRRPAVLLALATSALAVVALAQGPVWHEYVPDVEASEASALVSGGSDAEPLAIVHDGEILTAPTGGALRAGERAMRAAPGDGGLREEEGRRSPIFRPDRITSLEGSVGYYEVFSPAIRPYKRVTALDAVVLDAAGVPILTVGEPSRRARVPVEGAAATPPDLRPRDRFWGSVVLDFAEGREVPLPSVSPEARILTLRTEPETALHIERDPADNFFAVLEAGAAPGPVRVVFLTDAPRTYFGLEREASLPTALADPIGGGGAMIPPGVRADALAFARDLGLEAGQPFDRLVGDLTEHFRAFEEDPTPPRNTGNIFLDLARGMRGVCRHRAYAFVITALALGVSARFVQNEAHAWAEVHAPEHRGWIRVDLGGSAAGLEEHRAERDAPDYHPDVVDPFPQPEPYRRALEAAARASLAEAERRASAADATTNAGSPAEAESEAAGEASASSAAGWREVSETDTDAPRPTPVAGGADAPRRPLELTLDGDGTFEVLRGSTLSVTGVATSEGTPAAGVRVELFLLDRSRGRERLLGVTVTSDSGVFRTSVGVPPDTRPDEYELVVRSPGSATLLPATAR